MYNRTVYFNEIRDLIFGGSMTQYQVDGQNVILDAAERGYDNWDHRWLAYCLATTYHETAQTMQPIEEYGFGAGQPYGEPDPETGQIYYGRGYVQLTWRDNYERADKELYLPPEDSLVWYANNALDPSLAAVIMFEGMSKGWFRPPNKLSTYFSDVRDDPYGAREIINGDKTYTPDWANGASIGNVIAGHHRAFQSALQAAATLILEPVVDPVVTINISVPTGVKVTVLVNSTDLCRGVA